MARRSAKTPTGLPGFIEPRSVVIASSRRGGKSHAQASVTVEGRVYLVARVAPLRCGGKVVRGDTVSFLPVGDQSGRNPLRELHHVRIIPCDVNGRALKFRRRFKSVEYPFNMTKAQAEAAGLDGRSVPVRKGKRP